MKIDRAVGSLADALTGAGNRSSEPDEKLAEGLRTHVIHTQDNIGDILEDGIIHINSTSNSINVSRSGANRRANPIQLRPPVVAGLAVSKK